MAVTTEATKVCLTCVKTKPLNDFHKDRRRPDGHVGHCKLCRKEYRARWYAENHAGQIAYAADWKRRNRHRLGHYNRNGITQEQFDALVIAQEGRCAICERADGDLRVDHCHARKVIRGLLCDRCNRGLGYFADDHEALSAAAAYVQREGVMPYAR